MSTAGPLRAPAARDIAALAIAVVLSAVWYAPRLGFYSDDWAFIGRYATSPEQTVGGFFDASHSDQHAMRPVQLWLCALLYRLFGMDPLGYHLFNGVLLVLNPILCYAIARELRAPRTIALSVALTYGLLPSYSTDRYWYVACAITLSMTACLASIYADLKAAAARVGPGVAWKILGAAALLLSGLSYEVALPLLLVVPFLMIWRTWQEHGHLPRQRMIYLGALIAINVVLLAGVTVFKLRTTVRLGAEEGLVAQINGIARHAVRTDLPEGEYGLNLFSAVHVHFGHYGVKLPGTAATLARGAPAAVLWLTVVFALAAFAYITRAVQKDRWPSVREWGAVVLAGIVIFGLGYAIFLTNDNVQFTAAGIANRSAIAAGLGAAMCIVGCIGLLVTPLSTTRLGPLLFAALVAAFASSGFLIINVVAERWIAAYAAERTVLAGIRQRFPTLPPHSTLILDGVCPYIGPAIVFESNWDLAGALQAIYRDETLRADVVTPRLVVGDDAITTTIYQQPTRYPYGKALFVYHAGSGAVQPLRDAASARAYFATSTGARSCPPGQEGIGVGLF
jgi:hypothetical protein